MTAPARPRFASVILDVDSTLCGIEGIDWLARRRGPETAGQIAELTDRAMRGEIPLESVYGERLRAVRPTARDIEALAETYRATVAPGAADAIRRMREAGVALHLISGGIRRAILPVARDLGFADADVHAVEVRFAKSGECDDHEPSPLTTDNGKLEIVRSLHLKAPSLAVGDGNTDLAMMPAVDTFAAFTGFIRRERVVTTAKVVLASFDELASLVLG